MGETAKHPVRTSERTLEIMEALQELNGARVTELASHLDTGKSTIHNHLSTLLEHEYVTKEGDEYRLSLRFLTLGGYTRSQMRLYRVAESEVKRLATETGELVNLLTEEYGRGVYLYRSKGERAVDIDTYAGKRIYLHNTALGKAILAHTPEERVGEIVDKHGLPRESERTITDRSELREELDRTRERGYAIDDEERLPGLRCVAAPIEREDGGVYGAISLSAPVSRMKGPRFEEEIPEIVQSATNVVELNLNYSQ
jgi:DNA-binding IclR family transcriptional regulator